MKKIFKFMMMALVATVMTIGFAACSSDDDDSTNIYTAGFDGLNISGSPDGTTAVMGQIEDAYNAVGIKESFTASSDADVKAKAQQAEPKLTNIDWKDCKGSLTFTITNVKSNKAIYSKTFSSSDSGSNAIK